MRRKRWLLPMLVVAACVLGWWWLREPAAPQPGDTGHAIATAPDGTDRSPVEPTDAARKPGGATDTSGALGTGGAATQDARGPHGSDAQPSPADRTLGVRPKAERSKVLLPPGAAPNAWAKSIAFFGGQKNVVALQAIAEAAPGRTREERAQLAALSVRALASLGAPAKPAFDDLLVSPDRMLRLAALNAYAVNPALYGTTSERQRLLERTAALPDLVVRAKARALLAALR